MKFLNQKGAATMMSFLVVVILVFMSAGLLPFLRSETKAVANSRDVIEAQYAAEAGAKRAITEFGNINLSQPMDWTWLDTYNPYIDDVNSKKYRVFIYDSADTNKAHVIPDTASNHLYVITSTGIVGNAQKIVTVYVNITGGGGSGGSGGGSGNNDVFSKYTLFSSGTMQIDNNPTITGDIGSNSTITVNSSSPLIHGVAYTPNVPKMDQYTWNKNAVTGGYSYAKPAGTLDVASLIPTMPTYTSSGTNLTTVKNTTLSSGAYYSSGSYTMNGETLSVGNGQSIILYINGDLHLTTSSKISGGNVTIYATGSILIDNSSSIQTTNFNMYSNGSVQLTNYASITADAVTIQTNSTINFNSNSSINKNSTTAVNKIYAKGNIEFTNNFEMDGKAGMVVTRGAINLNSNVMSPKTVFVSGSGNSQVTNGVTIAGIYSNGTLSINSSPTISFGSSKDTILGSVGLGGAASASIQPGSWSIQ